MKTGFALGLILPAAMAISSIPHTLTLNATELKAISGPFGIKAVDPTITCDATYTLTADCSTGPCTITLTALSLTNCVVAP